MFEKGLAYKKDHRLIGVKTVKPFLLMSRLRMGVVGVAIIRFNQKSWNNGSLKLPTMLTNFWSGQTNSLVGRNGCCRCSVIGSARVTVAKLIFKFEGNEKIKVFTTRPDTLAGATFMSLAPEHPMVAELVTAEQKCRK